MTTKEIVDFTGKSVRTVRNWINKADLQGCAKTALGEVIDYTIDEVEQILNAGSMSKDAVSILMQNARKPAGIEPHKNIDSNILMTFMVQMQKQQQEFMTAVLSKLGNTNTPLNNQLSLPHAPDIEPRNYLNQLVREYSQLKSVDYQKAWNILYTEMLYRCKTNIKVKAKNEGIRPIDYLEQSNQILTACSIMKGLIN